MVNKPRPDYKLFKTVIPGWDNTPRRQNQSLIFANSSPNLYKNWLEKAISYAIDNGSGEDNLVFINAWNEWAESAYLEPDQKYGYAYLRATIDAVRSFRKNNLELAILEILVDRVEKKHETAVLLHLYYPELWDEMQSYFKNLENDFDLFVSIPQNQPHLNDLIKAVYPDAKIWPIENRGRDMLPFIQLFSIIYPLNYQYICKLHTKKSQYSVDGSNWRKDILDELMESSAVIQMIKNKLDQEDIGMVGPYNNLLSTFDYIGGNEGLIRTLAHKLNVAYDSKPFTFIAGSMFWLKPSAISNILELRLTEKDFPIEEGQRDATMAHALERFICFLSENNGYKIIQTRDFTANLSNKFSYATPSH